MSGGIIEDEDVVIFGVVLLKDIYCNGDLSQDVIVREISATLCAWANDNTS